jgi:hypothetical protein
MSGSRISPYYLLGAFFTASMAFLPASFASPAASRTAPFTWSTLPSVSSFLLPVTCPAASLVVPTALSAAPLTCSLFVCHLYTAKMPLRQQTARLPGRRIIGQTVMTCKGQFARRSYPHAAMTISTPKLQLMLASMARLEGQIIGAAILQLLRGKNSRSTVFAAHVSTLQGFNGEKWKKIS